MRKKVTVVGAGNVGANCALRIADKELADVVLVDVVEGVPQGKGLDILQSGPVQGYDVSITGANDYASTADSDIAIITAGLARKPGMSRDDLLYANNDVVRTSAEQVAKYSPNCIVIVVTNPLDVMTQAAFWATKFPKNRVVGMAGVLDSARFRTFIAEELKVSVENVTGVVMGGHGDTMVPIVRLSSVSGIPLTELIDQGTLDRIVDRTRNGGAEIVKYLKTGSAYYAPSASAVEMAEAILKDKKKVLPCSAYLEGEYGIDGLYVGVPVKLGAGGVEKIYEVRLTDDEMAMLKKSAASVQEMVDVVSLRIPNREAAVTEAIRRAGVYRQNHDPSLPIMVEVESLTQLDAALAGRPEFVLLDNMSVDDMTEAVRRRNAIAPGVQLEASGGVTLATVRSIAETGVDRISVGALTHSAPAWDLALDFEA